ncbi:MAG: hypothetical protein HRU21_02760 [Pseudomonadales bacterium]|nr:hypothetical protein [Pseudomonadales bacterium]
MDHLSDSVMHWLNAKKPKPAIPLCDFQRICQSIQVCDVLLIEGRSRVAEVIKIITQSSWSHAALYIGRIDEIQNPRLKTMIKRHYTGAESDPLIAESELGLGTVVRPIHAYAGEHIRICRPVQLSAADKQSMLRYVASCLGYAYNIRQILDLARFLFPWHILPRRYRSSLFKHNIGDATKTVCSTMLCEAFNFVQYPILPLIESDENHQLRFIRRNPKLCVPSDFDYSPYFQIIKYPLLHQAEYDYKDLPWHSQVASEIAHVQADMQKDEDEINQKFIAQRILERGERRQRQQPIAEDRRKKRSTWLPFNPNSAESG